MPIRLVREGINSSPRINALSRGAELFYRRLMSVVDDYGRFHGSPATLRGACWPTCPENVTEGEVKQWLEECLHVHSKCLADDYQPPPLLVLYESNGAKYIQLIDFKQQTRSASKYPEPAKQLLSNCYQNVQPRRETKTETKTKFEDEDEDGNRQTDKQTPPENPPSWMLDQQYVVFVDLYRKFRPRVLDEELSQGYQWHWTKLDFDQRVMATKNLRSRLESGEDGEFVKHMPEYLKTEWKRGPKHENGNRGVNGNGKPHNPAGYEYEPPPGIITDEKFAEMKREREERMKR